MWLVYTSRDIITFQCGSYVCNGRALGKFYPTWWWLKKGAFLKLFRITKISWKLEKQADTTISDLLATSLAKNNLGDLYNRLVVRISRYGFMHTDENATTRICALIWCVILELRCVERSTRGKERWGMVYKQFWWCSSSLALLRGCVLYALLISY